MIHLFAFLLIALITIYAIKPSNKTQIWLSSILIPLGIMVFYVLLNATSAYFAGEATAKSLLPAIISGIVIYFLLKKKFENENRIKFPVGLVIAIAIALIIGIVQLTLEYKTKNLFEKLSNRSESIYKDNAENTAEESKTVSFNYQGLSFVYPEDWEIEKEVILADVSYQVSCEKGFYSSDIITITWIRITDLTDLTALEAIENNIEALQEETILHAKIGTLYNGTFKGQSSVSVDYSVSVMKETFYGTITSFIMNGNVVSIMKQSDSKAKLNTAFKLIEESFNIDIP